MARIAAKTQERAIEALAAYAQRYAPVAASAGVRWPAILDFEVVERLTGTTTSEFGSLDKAPEADAVKITAFAASRQASLLQASWDLFDGIAATAPAAWRKDRGAAVATATRSWSTCSARRQAMPA